MLQPNPSYNQIRLITRANYFNIVIVVFTEVRCGRRWSEVVSMLAILLSVAATLLPATRGDTIDPCPVTCICNAIEGIVDCGSRHLRDPPFRLAPATRHLNLSHNNLSTLEDGAFTELHELRSLDLSFNNLSNISDHVFRDQRKLQNLSLAGNHLDGKQLQSVRFLTSLQKLDLSHNDIHEIDTDFVFANITRLESLNLNGNEIRTFAISLPYLETLTMDGNKLQSLSLEGSSNLRHLSLSNNELSRCPDFSSLPNLTYLNLAHNRIVIIDSTSFASLVQLRWLTVSSNPVANIGVGSFQNCSSLEDLHISSLWNLTHVNNGTFSGLDSLLTLNASHNTNLRYIHAAALSCLGSLRTLDISHNALSSLHTSAFQGLASLRSVALHHNPWRCDCDTRWLRDHVTNNTASWRLLQINAIVCATPTKLADYLMVNIQESNITCVAPMITTYQQKVAFAVGSQAVVNCIVVGDPKPDIVWITPRRKRLHYHPAFVDHAASDPGDDAYFKDQPWHRSTNYDHNIDKLTDGRLRVLKNGSLYIDYVSRHDTGHYFCTVQNSLGNATVGIFVMLDYVVMAHLTNVSMLIAIATDVAFVVVIATFMLVCHLVAKCRNKHHPKQQNSIHNLLDLIQGYKSDKLATLCAYKTDKIVKLSAKIMQLRTYGHDASVLVHIDSMREQYAARVARIRDNCAQQMERLHENYDSHLGRLKDYRSAHIDSMRDSYAQRVQRIRDYGTQQLERLREQYKMQQSYMLKLVEILDIGNCLNGIEAECKRNESMLFNGDIIDTSAFPDATIDSEHAFPAGGATDNRTFQSSTASDSDDSYATASIDGDNSPMVNNQVTDRQYCASTGHADDDDRGNMEVTSADNRPSVSKSNGTPPTRQNFNSNSTPLLSALKLQCELARSPTVLSIISDDYASSQYDSALSQTESPMHTQTDVTPYTTCHNDVDVCV